MRLKKQLFAEILAYLRLHYTGETSLYELPVQKTSAKRRAGLDSLPADAEKRAVPTESESEDAAVPLGAAPARRQEPSQPQPEPCYTAPREPFGDLSDRLRQLDESYGTDSEG